MIDFRNQDCMEGMKEYPDKYFDLAIVDPPYGISVTARHKAQNGSTPLVGGVVELSAVHGGYGNGRPAIGGAVTMKGESKSSKCRLNFIIRSTIARRRTVNTLKSYSEYQKRR